jgi:hypothetical protein
MGIPLLTPLEGKPFTPSGEDRTKFATTYSANYTVEGTCFDLQAGKNKAIFWVIGGPNFFEIFL